MMYILSLTFHCPESILKEWENYINETLVLMTENLMDVEKYILSDVESDMISEGKNYNLLLVFESDDMRSQFVDSELENIRERIFSQFGDSIMIFKTFLNMKKARF